MTHEVKPAAGEFWANELLRFARLARKNRVFATIRRGKIEPHKSCEVNAVDHCNQSCLDCNHGAPVLKERFADPEAVHEDLSTLSKFYRPKLIKVLGGEPLLHPDLRSVIDAVRSSGICDNILLLTNGVLIDEISDQILDSVNEVEVSLYPDGPVTKKQLGALMKRGRSRGKRVRAFYYRRFRVTMSMVGTRDDRLVERIFRTCKMGNEWGCHTIHQGRFYRCPQSVYIPRIVNDVALSPDVDGFEIADSPDFMKGLYQFINSRKPLESCRYCLGHAGALRRHTRVPREEWFSLHQEPTESLVDFERLERAEKGFSDRDIAIISVDGTSALLPD